MATTVTVIFHNQGRMILNKNNINVTPSLKTSTIIGLVIFGASLSGCSEPDSAGVGTYVLNCSVMTEDANFVPIRHTARDESYLIDTRRSQVARWDAAAAQWEAAYPYDATTMLADEIVWGRDYETATQKSTRIIRFGPNAGNMDGFESFENLAVEGKAATVSFMGPCSKAKKVGPTTANVDRYVQQHMR